MGSDGQLPIEPVDWDSLIAELQGMANTSLGNSASVPTDLLARAKRSPAGINSAIDSIANLQFGFVEPSDVLDLVNLMRARVAARMGLPPPPLQPRSPVVRRSGQRFANFIDDMGGLCGCFGNAIAIVDVALLLADVLWSWFRAA